MATKAEYTASIKHPEQFDSSFQVLNLVKQENSFKGNMWVQYEPTIWPGTESNFMHQPDTESKLRAMREDPRLLPALGFDNDEDYKSIIEKYSWLIPGEYIKRLRPIYTVPLTKSEHRRDKEVLDLDTYDFHKEK